MTRHICGRCNNHTADPFIPERVFDALTNPRGGSDFDATTIRCGACADHDRIVSGTRYVALAALDVVRTYDGHPPVPPELLLRYRRAYPDIPSGC